MDRINQKPNILLIMTDQQRFDSLGCYGATAAKTPNLDRLASEGMLFENCVVANPICTPSRASMWTGKDLPEHGVYRLYDNLHESEKLFPKILQEHGYTTGLFGKLHVSSTLAEAAQRHPNDGFDEYEWTNESCVCMESQLHAYRKWLEQKNPTFCRMLMDQKRNLKNIPRELHLTHWACERTMDFIERNTGYPWFACMSVFDPHNPYDCGPEEFRQRIDRSKIPEVVQSEMAKRPPEHLRESTLGYFGEHAGFSSEDIKDLRRGYYSMIELLDDEIGRIFEKLENSNQLDNTVIIFTSDHGDMLGDHQLLVKGAYFYDPCVKVPLLIRYPKRIAPETRIAQPVQNFDIAATVLALAQVPEKETVQLMPHSHNLMAAACGDQSKFRNYVFCRYRNTGIRAGNKYWEPEIHGTMIRSQRWKLTYYHSSDQGELYDMQHDHLEQTNLWGEPDYSKVQNKLLARLMDNVSQQEFERPPRGGEFLPKGNMIFDNSFLAKA